MTIKDRIKLFKYKNDFLLKSKDYKYKKISLKEYYNLIFSRNNILQLEDKEKTDSNYGYNSICVSISKEKSKNYVVGADLKVLNQLKNQDFVITSPITYVGKHRTAKNSRLCYGFAFDLDGVKENNIKDTVYQMTTGHTPVANIVVNSGNGLHLYYLFNEPIQLFDNIKPLLKKMKYGLTYAIWNGYSSSVYELQFQGIFQGFRIPETKTKFNTNVTAFYNEDSNFFDIRFLNKFVDEDKQLTNDELILIEQAKFKKRISLIEAKKLYPEWYQKRIIKGEKKGRWVINKALYKWWLRRCKNNEIKEGHRYFAIMILSIYAIKCNVDFKTLKQDAYSLLDPLDKITTNEDNHFTKKDIKDGLKAYHENYCTFPIHDIEKLSGIRINRNRRNYRSQELHLKGARAIQEINNPNWRENNGRKPKKDIVIQWRLNNPKGKKIDCHRDTKLSRVTIDKYWLPYILEP